MNLGQRSLRRMAVVARFTVREGLRQRPFVLLATMAGILAVGGLWLREFDFGGSETRFLMDAGLAAESAAGAILAIAATAQLFHAEIDRRMMAMVLARPVRRHEYLLGRLAGVLVMLLGYCLVMTGVLLGLLWFRGPSPLPGEMRPLARGDVAPYVGIASGGLVLWLRLGVVAAMTLLVATYARSALFTVLAGFLLLFVCQFQHLAREFLGAGASPWARATAVLVGMALPDLQTLDLTERAASDGTPSGLQLGAVALYALAYIGVFSALAAVSFRRREF